MKKQVIACLFLFAVMPVIPAYAASQAETEQLLSKITPPISVLKGQVQEKDYWSLDSYYEHSNVIQGSRPGRWNEITNRASYGHRNLQFYLTQSQWQRFDTKNYTAHFGSYINFPGSYLHLEAGWGWDVTYMYKFQSIAEYGHKIVKGLFWQAGYSYRNYSTNDTYTIYPGLIYYFGDSYISADYGLSLIERRGAGQFGTVKGTFALGKYLSWLIGAAVGERLYDIYELAPQKEYGYIIFTGFNINLYKNLSVRIGCSYGTEKPDFIKRSADVALSLKF